MDANTAQTADVLPLHLPSMFCNLTDAGNALVFYAAVCLVF